MMRSIRTVGLLATVPLWLLACKSSNFSGAAVDITVTADPPLARQIAVLSLSLSGSDTDELRVPTDGNFGTSGTQVISYRASSTSGTLAVTATGLTNSAYAIAGGSGTATLIAGKTPLAITLTEIVIDGSDMPVVLDMAPPTDMTSEPPAPVAIVPSHVSAGRYQIAAKPLSSVVAIDTTNLTVRIGSYSVDGGILVSEPGYDGGTIPANDGGFGGTPLEGISFVVDNGYAVLSVGSWTVDKEIYVTGTRPLIVVASGAVEVDRPIHVEADHANPGPGGAASGAGNGAGAVGIAVTVNNVGSAGGGAGFATKGGNGGAICDTADTTATFACTTAVPAAGTPMTSTTAGGGLGGAVYGNSIASLVGGSGGGNTADYYSIGPSGLGGAGGGVLQISSGSRITIGQMGILSAGGGGGSARYSCQLGGAGGGSGGSIFLEAREVVVEGLVAANGGSGAGPSCQTGNNASLGAYRAAGGVDYSYTNLIGGSGGALAGAAGDGTPAGFNWSSTIGRGPTGGGGSAGRIWVRVPAGKMPVVTGTVSPAPSIDTTLN